MEYQKWWTIFKFSRMICKKLSFIWFLKSHIKIKSWICTQYYLLQKFSFGTFPIFFQHIFENVIVCVNLNTYQTLNEIMHRITWKWYNQYFYPLNKWLNVYSIWEINKYRKSLPLEKETFCFTVISLFQLLLLCCSPCWFRMSCSQLFSIWDENDELVRPLKDAFDWHS